MNEVLKNLWSQIVSASGPVLVALGSCGLLLALVTSVMVWRAQNPHFVVLAADLDSHSFNGAVSALAEAGIRYETSVGGPPYVIQVESGRRHEAIAAMHNSGEFLDRRQGNLKRPRWLERRLPRPVRAPPAHAEAHVGGGRVVPREAELRLQGEGHRLGRSDQHAREPPQEQRAAPASSSRCAVSPPPPRPRPSPRRSDPERDGRRRRAHDDRRPALQRALRRRRRVRRDSLAAKEEQFNRERTEMAQRQLDRLFGPGVATAGVTSEWLQVQEESIVETLNPAKKPLSSRTRHERPSSDAAEHRRPRRRRPEHGRSGSQQRPSGFGAGESSSTEEQQLNSFGTTTTHSVKQPHQLQRLSVSLVVDASIEDRLKNAEDILKGFLGFNETRGDQLFSIVNEIAGPERDAEGAPVTPRAREGPEPTNPASTMAMEFGLEIIAGLAFLIVLVKSLKSAAAPARPARESGPVRPARAPRRGAAARPPTASAPTCSRRRSISTRSPGRASRTSSARSPSASARCCPAGPSPRTFSPRRGAPMTDEPPRRRTPPSPAAPSGPPRSSCPSRRTGAPRSCARWTRRWSPRSPRR